MYAWLFSRLPGPAWARGLGLLVLGVAAVAALFVWVFPAIEPALPFGQPGLDT